MKHLKSFESLDNGYEVEEMENRLRNEFSSEEEWEEWCMDADSKSDFDDVAFDNIVAYDIPLLLDLPTYNQKLIEILTDLLSDIDFDDYYEPRDGDYENWVTKNAANKYNL